MAIASRIGIAAALAALVMFVHFDDTTRASSFDPQISASVSNSTPGQPADINLHFFLPVPDPNFDTIVTFIPSAFNITADADVPDGALAGQLQANSTLGLLNGPCTTSVPVTFNLMEATTNTTNTVPLYYGFNDNDGDGLPENVDHYPDFLTRVAPGLQPVERLYGQELVAGVQTFLNFVIFAPATAVPRVPVLDASMGYIIMVFLNDPLSPPAPSNINDFCTPLTTDVVNFGTSKDNPATPVNEGGHVLRRNPDNAGGYKAAAFIRSQWDSDDDGVENKLDPCPYSSDPNWNPRAYSPDADPDNNGIPSSCDISSDPTADADGDGYSNRLDNCPFIAEPYAQDSDQDGIGNLCDQFPLDPTDAGAAHREEACLFASIQIGVGGPAAPQPICPAGPDTPVPPIFSVYPQAATLEVGTVNSLQAYLYDPIFGQPFPGVLISFDVTGANPAAGSCLTDNSGFCTFNYAGPNLGEDSIAISTSVNGQDLNKTATARWVNPPPNDDFADAIVIDTLPFEAEAQVAGAGPEATEPDGCGFGLSVWYKVMPTDPVFLRAEVEMADGGAAAVGIYTGEAISSLQAIACGYTDYGYFEGGPSRDAYAFAHLTAGQTYFVRVGAYFFGLSLGTSIPLELSQTVEGDTNCDDSANGLDILATLSAAAGNTLAPACTPAGDYNCNLQADLTDVKGLLRRIAGMSETMPVCPPPPFL